MRGAVLMLCVFTIVMEKVMCSRLSHHCILTSQCMPPNSLWTSEQFGLRDSIYTDYITFKVTDSTLTAFNQGMHVGGAICDVEKSFDCLNQSSAFRGPCALCFGCVRSLVTGLQPRNFDLWTQKWKAQKIR